LGHKKNDPQQKLETLERWSARATLLILLGIVIEIGSLLWFPHDPAERLVAIIANALIGVGLAVEYIVILRAVVASGEAQRLSDEKVAEATARAAEADRARAELEVKLQPRSLNQEQWDLIQGLRGKFDAMNIAYETDADTWWFARQLRDAFFSAGITGGMYRRAADVHSFGSFIYEPKGFDGARPRTVEPLVEIFRKADGPLGALAIIIGIPSDIQAPDDIPMIIVGGRFILPPPYLVFPRPEVNAAPTNANIKPQNTSDNRESSI
jgi:hypothetical protein